MRGLVSKRRSSQMRGKRVGSQEAVYEAGRRRGHARERLKLRGGGKAGTFGSTPRPGSALDQERRRHAIRSGGADRPDPGSPHRGTCGRPSRCASLVPKLGPGQRSPVFGTRPWARPMIELVSDLRPDLRAVRWRARKETGRRTDDGLVIGRAGGQREERGDGTARIKLHLTRDA